MINKTSSPISDYFHIGGNALPADADLICLAVDPKNPGPMIEYAALIYHIGYNCLIYGELISKGSEKEFPKFPHFSGKASGLVVNGWDLLSMADLVGKLESDINLLKILRKQIKNEMELHPESIVTFIKGGYRSKKGPIWIFLTFAWQEIREDWEKIYYSQTLHLDLNLFQCHIDQLLIKALFKLRQKQKELFKTTFQLRLRHLKNAIKEGLESKRKVIVAANHAFFMAYPHFIGEEYDISLFLSFLSKKKVAILISAKSSLTPPHFLPPSPNTPRISVENVKESKTEEDPLNIQEWRPSSPHLDELKMEDFSSTGFSSGYPKELEVEVKINLTQIGSQNILSVAPLIDHKLILQDLLIL